MKSACVGVLSIIFLSTRFWIRLSNHSGIWGSCRNELYCWPDRSEQESEWAPDRSGCVGEMKQLYHLLAFVPRK